MHLDGDADKRWREPELHSHYVPSSRFPENHFFLPPPLTKELLNFRFFLQWLGSSNGSLTWFLTSTDSKRPDSSISCRQAKLELCTSTQTWWRMMQVGNFCCFIVLYVLKMHFFWKWFWGNGTFNAHCSCTYSPGGVQRFNLSPCGLIIVRPNATKRASGSHCTASSCRVCYVASACWNHLPPSPVHFALWLQHRAPGPRQPKGEQVPACWCCCWLCLLSPARCGKHLQPKWK